MLQLAKSHPAFDLQIDLDKRLVKFIPRGLWRADDADAMREGFQQCAKRLGRGSPWYLLVDARQWSTQPPEVQQQVVQCMEDNRTSGLIRSARVVSPSVIKLQLDRLGLQSPLDRRDFADEREALEWLMAK